MRKEREPNWDGSTDDSLVDGGARRMALPHRGFRNWLLENYGLVYTLDVIVAYASLILYCASLVLIGRPNTASKIIFGMLVGSAAIGVLPFALSRYGNVEESFRTALKVRRPKKTERLEIIVAVSLWIFIAIAVALKFPTSQSH